VKYLHLRSTEAAANSRVVYCLVSNFLGAENDKEGNYILKVKKDVLNVPDREGA